MVNNLYSYSGTKTQYSFILIYRGKEGGLSKWNQRKIIEISYYVCKVLLGTFFEIIVKYN